MLLAQTEVAEVAEASGGGRGGSSAMPHKRNPVGADPRAGGGALGARGARACCWRRWPASTSARRAPGTASGARCPTRSAGTGGAAWSLHEALAGLTVDPERMRANLSDDLRGESTGAANAFIDRALELE